MELTFTREQALDLLKKYNTEEFHLRHAYTVEGVMRWYATELGYREDAEFWAMVGLLHDVDFEQFPDQHCHKAPELLAEIGASQEFIHAVVCHSYLSHTDVEPVHQMEKVLYACDELTGLIWSYSLMRPEGLTGMKPKSLRKKYKDLKFAAGCSREVIDRGAEMLGWELSELMLKTITAMQDTEEQVESQL